MKTVQAAPRFLKTTSSLSLSRTVNSSLSVCSSYHPLVLCTFCCFVNMRILIVFALISSALSVDMFGRPPVTCAGGFTNGASVDRGRYRYVCRDGRLDPVGCYSETHQPLELYGEYASNGYVYECKLDKSGDLKFGYKGCVSDDGAHHGPSDSWQDEGFWYTCVSLPDERLNIEISGCVFQGRRYAVSCTVFPITISLYHVIKKVLDR